MFSYVSLEERVPAKHPLRAIRQLTDRALRELSADFDAMYSQRGRPSIPPEQLLRALVLQCLYSIRSERQLMEQIDYNLLYRWFVGLAMDAARWDETVFTKNRDRLIEAAVAHKLLAAVLRQARQQQLLSAEHFTVDGTLLEASANRRSFVEKEQPDEPRPGMRGKRGLNEKVGSKTDPDARLYRKSHTERSKPAYLGHVLTENRNSLIVAATVSEASFKAERDQALEMLKSLGGRGRRVTLAADKAYDQKEFVKALHRLRVTPHVAQYEKRRSAIDRRTTRHRGYEISNRKRRRIEKVFGWLKEYAGMRRMRHRGQPRVGWMFVLSAAAYNLVRMEKLAAQSAA